MIGYARPARTIDYEPTIEVARLAKAAPRPTSIAQTGLSATFLTDLVAKHLLTFGATKVSESIKRLELAGPIVEQILQFMRGDGRAEVRGRLGADGELRYGLTERGRADAMDALMRSGYVGPAPVALEDYCDVVEAQSIRKRRLTREQLHRAFADVVLSETMCDQLGPALNSGRGLLLHGAPGTGKTFVAQRLARILPDLILVPYAIAVNDTVIELFDPLLHVEVALNTPASPLVMAHGWDTRYACCERPVVTAAGELTIDMLEVQRDPIARTFVAPLQLKANNGIFLIDDLGRQRAAPQAIFDRWIVPMEEGRDYLSAGNGQHFAVPFDEVVIFSTNIEPRELADEAFLRRISYKIEFRPVTAEQYSAIWQYELRKRELYYDPGVLDYVLHELYPRQQASLLPSHPRDLIGMALDLRIYRGESDDIDERSIEWAWKNYFLQVTAAPRIVDARRMQGDRHV